MPNKVLDLTSNLKVTGSAKGLVKGLALVDIVAANEEPMRQVDLVESSGLPRPTAVRLLETLCDLDVLNLNPQGLYELGPRVAGWGQAFLHRLDLVRLASDIVQRLVDLSGETVFLGVAERGTLLYVCAVHSPQPVRPSARVGSRNPLHCTGVGKVLLAALTDADRDQILSYPLERRTPNTITDREALYEHLNMIRENGFAIDNIENEDGVRCVAAPVRDHTGKTIAAMSISAPEYRFSPDDILALAPELVRSAAQLSARLGYRESASLPRTGTTTSKTRGQVNGE